MVGDKTITPVEGGGTTAGFVHKNLCIAKSGIYEYNPEQYPNFGLTGDGKPDYLPVLRVYRPPEVLIEHRNLFSKVPIILGNHQPVNPDNVRKLVAGFVGDTVEYEYDSDGELALYTTGTICAGDALDNLDTYHELSPGYTPKAVWDSGVHKGQKYDARLVSFEDVNHLLLCKTARGGSSCAVMDSKECCCMNIRSSAFVAGLAFGKEHDVNLEKLASDPQLLATIGDALKEALKDSSPTTQTVQDVVKVVSPLLGDCFAVGDTEKKEEKVEDSEEEKVEDSEEEKVEDSEEEKVEDSEEEKKDEKKEEKVGDSKEEVKIEEPPAEEKKVEIIGDEKQAKKTVQEILEHLVVPAKKTSAPIPENQVLVEDQAEVKDARHNASDFVRELRLGRSK